MVGRPPARDQDQGGAGPYRGGQSAGLGRRRGGRRAWRRHSRAPHPGPPHPWRSRGQGSQLGGLKNVGSYPGSGSRRDQRCLSASAASPGANDARAASGSWRPPPPHAEMTRSLLRKCLDCPALVRGRPRCTDCRRVRDLAKSRRKAARRPDLHNDQAERKRRAQVVAEHRAIVGDWCPGLGPAARPPSADLTADHVREVAAGGRPDGRLVVRCRSCNAARSAAIAHRILTGTKPPDPSPPEHAITHLDGDDPGPVAA